jgi:hypothetical protein
MGSVAVAEGPGTPVEREALEEATREKVSIA